MPRYCAVKVCRSRDGTASRQGKRRISFYPFPLQDKDRLQKWVKNMKREYWAPSRHQYLCSGHFTEDCVDIRWGIRYLRNTAIPTIFPPTEEDGEKQVTPVRRSPTARFRNVDTDPAGFDSPLIFMRTCKKSPTKHTAAEYTEMTFEPPLMSDTGFTFHSNVSEIETVAHEVPGCSGMPTVIRFPLSQSTEPYSEEQAESTLVVLSCKEVGPGETDVEADAFSAVSGHVIRVEPMEMIMVKPEGSFLGERELDEGEHICDHSYCRQDTDTDQLWSKILRLRAKVSELDRREESTLAKIRTLESQISLLKRDVLFLK